MLSSKNMSAPFLRKNRQRLISGWRKALVEEAATTDKVLSVNQNMQFDQSMCVLGVSSRNGKNRTLRPSTDHSTKKNAPELDYSSFYVTTGNGNTPCLVAQDLVLLTTVRTLIHEESALNLLKFPFRVHTPLGAFEALSLLVVPVTGPAILRICKGRNISRQRRKNELLMDADSA
jgi:hypothetical protein